MKISRSHVASAMFFVLLFVCGQVRSDDKQTANLPARDKFHLFLLVGQSNMAGRGEVADSDRAPHSRVLTLTKDNRWVPAVDPIHFDKSSAGVGLGKSFGIEIAESNPEITVGLVPCAVGGSPISSWEPGGYHASTKTHPYNDAIARAELALKAGTLKGILWHQGESDAKPGLAEVYEEKLHALVARLRKALGADDVPFIAGQMGQFDERPWSAAMTLVDAAHRNLPQKVAHTAFVSSKGLAHKGDEVHFDAASYREFGKRYATAYVGLIGQQTAEKHAGARVVEFYGYGDCIRLENESTKVTLCPAAGGRVLQFSWKDKESLYLPPGSEGWTYEPGKPGGSMTAGRFDIGPEQTIPAHPQLWMGRWKGEIIGPRSARLTSIEDEASGVQLIREFTLAADSSRLECRQTIRNVSKQTKEYCHWSRTFALGGGICLIPLTSPSRFPNGYVMYDGDAPKIDFRPVDPQIRIRNGYLEILAAPRFPKLGMDTSAGWFAYLMRNDLMFIKQFPAYPDRVYNEVAGLTMSIWYPDRPMCELEPIGPRERLEPGESASFTETWLLLPHEFPAEGQQVDIERFEAQIAQARAEGALSEANPIQATEAETRLLRELIADVAGTTPTADGQIEKQARDRWSQTIAMLHSQPLKKHAEDFLPELERAALLQAKVRQVTADVKAVNGTVEIAPGAPDWLRQIVSRSQAGACEREMQLFDRLVGIDLLDKSIVPKSGKRTEAVDDAWIERLVGLSDLKTLQLQSTAVTNAGMVHVNKLTSLERLSLTLLPVNHEGLKDLTGLTNVTHLSLASTQCTGEGMQYLIGMKRLENLNFHYTPVNDAGLEQIGKFPGLERLEIVHVHFTDAGAAHLSKLTGLARLQVGSRDATGAAVAPLARLRNLRELDLHDGQATDEGLGHACRIDSLKVLRVYGPVTDAGIEHLERLHNLEVLLLPYARLSDAHVVRLSQLRKLRELTLPKQTADEVVARLQAELPHAKIAK